MRPIVHPEFGRFPQVMSHSCSYECPSLYPFPTRTPSTVPSPAACLPVSTTRSSYFFIACGTFLATFCVRISMTIYICSCSTCVNPRACDAFPATRHKPRSFSYLSQANRACARKGTGLEKAPGLDSFLCLSYFKKLEKCKKDSV